VGILKGFPKSVGSVESRLYGFPRFPHSVISMACLGGRDQNVKLPKSPFVGKYWQLLILRRPLNVIDHHNL
jgi:hypothetical protein